MNNNILDKLINEYNKLINYTIMLEHPSFLDLFKSGLGFVDDYPIFIKKPNRYIGTIFLLLCDIHEIDDRIYIDDGLRKIRTVSFKPELRDYMNELRTDILEQLSQEFVNQELNIIDEVMSFLEEEGVSELIDMPTQNPFSDFYLIQDKYTPDIDKTRYVDDMIFDLFELDVDDKEVYAYNLLRRCPYAHSSLAMFLNIDQVTDYKQLLNVIIRAFELLHKNEMYKIKNRFYYYENYRDFILALESLASIHKWEGDFQSAIEQYQKVLEFDDLDVLNVKESILLPLLAEGEFEMFLDYTEQLGEESLFYTYVKLFNGLVNTYEALDYKLFEDALTASPLIMKMLCTNEDLYEKASSEERRYLDDFYTVWLMQEDLLETLKNLYYKNTIS